MKGLKLLQWVYALTAPAYPYRMLLRSREAARRYRLALTRGDE
jgi:hypothetical protein